MSNNTVRQICGRCKSYRSISCGKGICSHKKSESFGEEMGWTHKGCKKFFPK